jgi:hypothetical protein
MENNEELYTAWCEWEIGENGMLFYSLEDFEVWAVAALKHTGIEDSFDELLADGFIGLSDTIIYKRPKE